jgi:lipid II:glycine glycyltransferase (peptidoglycan interpeptide bridge formation enzyme)
MHALLAHNMLDLSLVVETNRETGQRQVLAFHAHSLAASTARLLYSSTAVTAGGEQQRPERVPDANTWLHWQDMLRFREQGIQTYDMGGWHDGQDPELLRLNYFKESFGGQVAARYYADQGLTLRGKAAVLARRIQGRLRGNR